MFESEYLFTFRRYGTTIRFASLCGDLISKEVLRLMDSTSGIALIPRMYLFKMKFEWYS